jgi:hypothetical protein
MTHSSKLPLVPLNFTELGWSRGTLRASEESLVELGKVFALVSNRSDGMIDNHCCDVTKIRFPAVLGHRIFARAPEREFGSCKFLATTKLILFIGCTESNSHCSNETCLAWLADSYKTEGRP